MGISQCLMNDVKNHTFGRVNTFTFDLVVPNQLGDLSLTSVK
jgi:hypothetical protein